LGAEIVAAGWAVPDNGYIDEANAARDAKRGIWSGSFIAPAQWRRGDRGEGQGLWDWITSWFG
jgi:endonuclease YncB( thermonuclease family)